MSWRAAAATALLTLAVGGTAHASIPDGSGLITSCYTTDPAAFGALRVIDVGAAMTCNGGENQLTFNQQGPQGIQGPRGRRVRPVPRGRGPGHRVHPLRLAFVVHRARPRPVLDREVRHDDARDPERRHVGHTRRGVSRAGRQRALVRPRPGRRHQSAQRDQLLPRRLPDLRGMGQRVSGPAGATPVPELDVPRDADAAQLRGAALRPDRPVRTASSMATGVASRRSEAWKVASATDSDGSNLIRPAPNANLTQATLPALTPRAGLGDDHEAAPDLGRRQADTQAARADRAARIAGTVARADLSPHRGVVEADLDRGSRLQQIRSEVAALDRKRPSAGRPGDGSSASFAYRLRLEDPCTVARLPSFSPLLRSAPRPPRPRPPASPIPTPTGPRPGSRPRMASRCTPTSCGRRAPRTPPRRRSSCRSARTSTTPARPARPGPPRARSTTRSARTRDRRSASRTSSRARACCRRATAS